MSLFQTLKPKPKSTNSSTCLLLDVSGSMDMRIARPYDEIGEDGLDPRRVDQMFKVVRETPECQGIPAYTFSVTCDRLEVIPLESDTFRTQSSTDLANAFRTLKLAGFFSAILVTDGEPDSESRALEEAQGMKLGIIYIGNPPVPHFLERLATATDGTFALADMRDTKQLEEALIKALPAPEGDAVTLNGAIEL